MDIIYKGGRAEILSNSITMSGKDNPSVQVGSDNGQTWRSRGYRTLVQNITTASVSAQESESGTTYLNSGSSVTSTINLPASANSGTYYNFIRTSDQALRVDPGSGARIIYSGGAMSTDEYLELASLGAKLTLICDGSNNWIATIEGGTLTEETP